MASFIYNLKMRKVKSSVERYRNYMKAVSRVISVATPGASKVDVIYASAESYWEDLEGALVEATDKSFG